MKRHLLKPLLKPVCLAAALAAAGPALAANLDFSGSNIYMKFLDGDQRRTSDASGDTASGADQGQWTEFELRIKATISKQVEAGVRIQSRSPAAYWTDFGFNNNEGFPDSNARPQQSKFMKLRGAYVLLTPGYTWLDTALIGSSDWGQFDPFTLGQVRYIDRDNYNGLYFKGPLPVRGASWEFARLSLPNYLQSFYGAPSDAATSKNEAVYIGQLKGEVGGVKLTTSYQQFNDKRLNDVDGDPYNGQDDTTLSRNSVFMLKGEGTVGGIDLRGAYYRSKFKADPNQFTNEPWINSPRGDVSDRAFKIDVGLNSLPVSGLTVNYQYFNIGKGYYSNVASRREVDVLLTEGSEAAWYKWGDPLWIGGAAKDFQQAPSSAKCFQSLGGVCTQDLGLRGSANGLVDNDFIDFDEAPNESVQGWKGHTVVLGWEFAKTPLSVEYTRLGYNYNTQGAAGIERLTNYFNADSDRKTSIFVAKASHVLPVAGGVELSAKYKRVKDRNGFNAVDVDDDVSVTDSGWTLGVGNQLFGDLYGSLSYGRYDRDYDIGSTPGNRFSLDNHKNITSVRLAYNLAGFETGVLAQWIRGEARLSEIAGNPAIDGDVKQYRMKAFVKAIF